MQDDRDATGWVKLYHPSGAQITVPLDLNVQVSPDQAATLLGSVSSLIGAGLSVFAPGLEEGEQYEQIGWAVRREKEDTEGPTPVIDLYPINGKFRFLAVYLNNADDVKAFEAATGLSVTKMPLYEATNTIERGVKAALDKYVVQLRSPTKIVWKANPRYDPEEKDVTKKKPRRLFVRWADLAPKSDQPEQTGDQSQPGMAFEAAIKVLSPGGTPLGQLSHDKLSTLVTSKNPKVTDDMRQAAAVILKVSSTPGASQ